MENEEKKEVKNHQSYSSMHPKKVSSPLCCKRKGGQIPVAEEEEIWQDGFNLWICFRCRGVKLSVSGLGVLLRS